MSVATAIESFTYNVDPNHSSVRFWVRHLMISKVHGELSPISGTVVGNLDQPEVASIDVTIKTASLTTSNEQRDAHLKSADFFDVEKYPEITFKSTKITKVGDGEFSVVGDVTMHGVTKEITLQAEVSPEAPSPWGGFKVGVSATGKINREDFGITWNQALEAGGVVVGQDINLQIDVELDRAA